MDGHGVMTVVACAGDLAFGALAFLRRSKSPLAGLISLLFLDAFAWNFASLAYELSGVALWHRVDLLFSSLMPGIALHVVIVFVGRSRAFKPVIAGGYVLFSALGVFVAGDAWWKMAALLGPSAMALAAALLLVHRRRSTDTGERARAELLLLAILVGTVFGCTDLWYQEVDLPVPRLGAIGTLLAMVLIATATLRWRLLGRAVPPALALYALSLGVFWAALQLALSRWLDARTAIWLLGIALLLGVVVAAVREVGRFAAIGRARTEELATLGRFSEQLAHDIKNPLAALKGAVQYLEEEHRRGRSLDAQTEFLALMSQQLERVQAIVSDYQRMAKVEPRPSLTSLTPLVAEVLTMQRFRLVKAVTIDSQLDPGLPQCPLDRELVSTALENLLRNACDAMPEGGTIAVQTSYDPEAEMVSVSVRDDGAGMNPRELEQATKLFFTTKAQGMGLGLSFAEKVARAHGGVLSLASTLGRGTTASMSFRARASDAS